MRRAVFAIALTCMLAVLCLPASAAGEGEEVFRFAILSDRTGGHIPGVYPRVLEAINEVKPAFVVTVGDHIEGYGTDYDRAEAAWDSLALLLQKLDTPVYVTPGNHDIWDDTSEELYRERTGREPDYSFEHENSHFIILDNSRLESWDTMGIAKITWLKRDLGQNDKRNVFVFFHKPFWDQTLRRGKRDVVHEMLLEGGVEAVFCGHYHRYFAGEYDGIDYTAIGSSGGFLNDDARQPLITGDFFQFAVVTVFEDGYELELHELDTGDVFPRDLVTVDVLNEIEHIEGDLVKMTSFRVSDEASESSAVTVSIRNETVKTLDGEAFWEVPEQWDVDPETAEYSIPPGATHELEFEATRDGGIYPAPNCVVVYPLADGRKLEVEEPANIIRKIDAPRLTQAFVVDGENDEGFLERAALVTELYAGSGYEPVEGATEFRFAHDTENLFVSAVCFEEVMEELVSASEERDGAVYNDDCVGFFFQPDLDDPTVYQVYVNPDGAVFDQQITFDENMWWTQHPEWDGEYEIATSRGDDRWTFEMRVPFDSLKGEAEPGDQPVLQTMRAPGTRTWRINFRRKQQRTGGSSDWQVPIDYNPESFGEIDLQ
jgi:hypothetical protein